MERGVIPRETAVEVFEKPSTVEYPTEDAGRTLSRHIGASVNALRKINASQ